MREREVFGVYNKANNCTVKANNSAVSKSGGYVSRRDIR